MTLIQLLSHKSHDTPFFSRSACTTGLDSPTPLNTFCHSFIKTTVVERTPETRAAPTVVKSRRDKPRVFRRKRVPYLIPSTTTSLIQPYTHCVSVQFLQMLFCILSYWLLVAGTKADCPNVRDTPNQTRKLRMEAIKVSAATILPPDAICRSLVAAVFQIVLFSNLSSQSGED